MAWRRLSAAIVGVLVLAVLSGCGAPPPPDAPPARLRILLVNANGWTSPGIVMLRDSLRRAGHTVTQVSPLTDRRSSGTAVTMPPAELLAGPPTPDPLLWATSGTASDATLVGLRAVMGTSPPDLVIAGIDSRPNVSVSATSSGTVGAAFMASEQGYPAIAVSADVPDPDHPQEAQFGASSDFVVRLVEELARRPSGVPLLPAHTVLNVNYPRGPARGVESATTRDTPDSSVFYRAGSRPGLFLAATTPNDESAKGDDTRALAAGNVTLSDLSADPDRTEPPPRVAVRLAPTLRP